ncbi:MAG: BamA/TamA family outer membrane protein, partial [Acetobacter sp.]|nr:BamA/TamA family outer membrane protein [Acetobacter sp.]
VTVGGTFAGLGGNERFFRARIKAAYFIPLDSLTNSHYWTLAFRVGVGELANWGNGQRNIMDNFYLGGNNLRGFMYGGVGPRTVATPGHEEENFIGGRFMYDGSVQLNFPIPFLTAMGVYGHVFSDFGSLAGVRVKHLYTNPLTAGSFYTPISGDTLRPRVSVGAGILWKSPFGILNINVGEPVLKSPEDVKQLFRFGFGQRF